MLSPRGFSVRNHCSWALQRCPPAGAASLGPGRTQILHNTRICSFRPWKGTAQSAASFRHSEHAPLSGVLEGGRHEVPSRRRGFIQGDYDFRGNSGHNCRHRAGALPNKKSDDGSISRLELGSDNIPGKKKTSYDGIFVLLLLNIGIFIADFWLKISGIRNLYLCHYNPQWYQFITSTFCHLSWNHLSSNLFFLYIFGKLVEDEGGPVGVWLSYLVTGVGANIVSYLLLPRSTVSAGASGAVFGLFAVSVLVKISFDWRKILEVIILGQFVVERVIEAAQASALQGGRSSIVSTNINHLAHLSGALVGAALIWALKQLPSGDTGKSQ